MKKGDKVRVTEKARTYVPWYELSDVEFTIVDVLEKSDSVPYNYVLNYPLFGKDWVQFFKEDEIIPIEEKEESLKKELEKLDKSVIIDIIQEHYDRLKKVAKDHKIIADKEEDDDDLLYGNAIGYSSALETYANRLRNEIKFKTYKLEQV